MNKSWEMTLAHNFEKQFGLSVRPVLDKQLCKIANEWAGYIQHHLILANQTVDAIMLAMQYAFAESGPNDVSDAKRVTTQLLVQIARDIKAINSLSSDGFAYQAISLAASTFEHGMMLVSIGNDNDRANKWLSHLNTKTNIDDVKSRVELALDKLEVANPGLRHALGDPYHGMYQALCSFKHGNPFVQQHIGAVDSEDGIQFAIFPIPDRKAVIATYWAFETAIWSGWLALASYVPHYTSHHLEMGEIINGMNRSFKELREIRIKKEREAS